MLRRYSGHASGLQSIPFRPPSKESSESCAPAEVCRIPTLLAASTYSWQFSIQYRMHPDISRLPSNLFYNGKLQDGPSMEEKTKRHWHSSRKFGTYRFFDVAHGSEESNGRSLKNMTECHMAVQLFDNLSNQYKTAGFDFAARTGIVSMYRAQIVELRRSFERKFGRDIVSRLHFNTVDGFQGQEKDIIILSCVRGGPNVQNVGFLSGENQILHVFAKLICF